MKAVRIIGLILALCILATTIIACGKKETQTSESVQTEAITEEERLPLEVEREDNGGREFRILLPVTNSLDYIEGIGNNDVQKSLYLADTNINEYLGINIVYTQIPGNWANRAEFNNRLLASAMDDSSEFDLIMAETSASYPYAMQNDLVEDITSISTIKLGNPWYLQNMVETYGINGKLFGIRSDASLSTYSSLGLIFFNTSLIEEYHMENPYKLVEENRWTAEQMFSMALQINSSDSGEGADLTRDTFGYVGHHVASRGYMTAFNVVITERNPDDGNVYIKKTADEALVYRWTYLYRKFEDNSSKLIVPVAADAENGENAFSHGRALFYNGFFSHATTFKDTEWDWGIVPVPKYDDEQDRYYTPAGTQAMMFMIMKNAYSQSLSGKMLEMKSYYNYYEAAPTYYEETLGYQYGRSEDHVKMVKLIRENSTLSFMAAMCNQMDPDPWNMFQMDTYIRNGTEKKSCLGGSVTSWYQKNVGAWNNFLTSLYRSLS